MNIPRSIALAAVSALLTLAPGSRAETDITNVINGVRINYGSGYYMVGSNGSFNALIVTNAGVLLGIGTGIIGNSGTSSNNIAIVTGAGSVWSNENATYLGATGSFNQLIVQNGGFSRTDFDFITAYTAASYGNQCFGI